MRCARSSYQSLKVLLSSDHIPRMRGASYFRALSTIACASRTMASRCASLVKLSA
jgi:hypothetical protein